MGKMLAAIFATLITVVGLVGNEANVSTPSSGVCLESGPRTQGSFVEWAVRPNGRPILHATSLDWGDRVTGCLIIKTNLEPEVYDRLAQQLQVSGDEIIIDDADTLYEVVSMIDGGKMLAQIVESDLALVLTVVRDERYAYDPDEDARESGVWV